MKKGILLLAIFYSVTCFGGPAEVARVIELIPLMTRQERNFLIAKLTLLNKKLGGANASKGGIKKNAVESSEQSGIRWKRVDQSHLIRFFNLGTDLWFFAREYKIGEGFKAGDTNNLISSFKKETSRHGRYEWNYRQNAVAQFAKELSVVPEILDSPVIITAIPSSKHKSDPDYSTRFEDTFVHLLKLKPNLLVESPIELAESVIPSHLGGWKDPGEIMKNYVWKGFTRDTSGLNLVVIDDVLTTGSHMRAYSDFLRSHGFKGNIMGLFWARAVRQEGS